MYLHGLKVVHMLLAKFLSLRVYAFVTIYNMRTYMYSYTIAYFMYVLHTIEKCMRVYIQRGKVSSWLKHFRPMLIAACLHIRT